MMSSLDVSLGTAFSSLPLQPSNEDRRFLAADDDEEAREAVVIEEMAALREGTSKPPSTEERPPSLGVVWLEAWNLMGGGLWLCEETG